MLQEALSRFSFNGMRGYTKTGEDEAAAAEKKIAAAGTVTVLIVEDNRINQKLTAKILEKNGYSYDVAANGKEALNLYRENRYDLVLMDCLMPEMDGYVATLKIRQFEKKNNLRRIPVIALTANVMKGERQKVLSAGMDDYIAKPVNPQNMIDLLEKWLVQA